MKLWEKIKTAFKSWVKRHIVDDVPPGLEDEFSQKYRRGWKEEK
jgi:hypothetical protein